MGDELDPLKPVVLTPFAAPKSQGLSISRMMQLVAAAAVACAAVYYLREGAVIGGVAFFFVTIICVGVFLAKVKASRQETLLLSLAIASERSMPLSAAALAFAEQYGRGFRNRVQNLAMMLDEGLPLPKAMERVRGLVTGESRLLAASGWESGQLGPALRQAAAMKLLRQGAWGPIVTRILYLTGLTIWMQVIFSFIMYFILPKFEAIFKDFGVPLPPVTMFTVEASHLLVNYGVVTGFFLVVEALILLLLPLSFMNTLELDLPFIDALFRRKHIGLILRSLALSVDGGQPIEKGLALLSRDYPSTWVINRLRLVIDSVRRGESWTASLHQYGLLRSTEAQTLDAGSRVGNLGWVLREVADASDRSIGYHLQFWSQMFFPIAVFAIGLIVALVCVAYFAPLVTLIERLA